MMMFQSSVPASWKFWNIRFIAHNCWLKLVAVIPCQLLRVEQLAQLTDSKVETMAYLIPNQNQDIVYTHFVT